MNEQDHLSLLDKEQLQMLVDAGGSESYDLFNEILELYIEESAAKIEEIKAHRDSGDYDMMGRAAHALSGSSANIGGLRVWKISKEMENLCKEENGPQAAAHIEDLESVYMRTVEALKAYGRADS